MEWNLGRKLFGVAFVYLWVPTTYALCRLIGYPRENAMVDRGEVLSDWEHYDKAVRYLTRVISIFPDNPRAYHVRGMALLNLDRHDEAIQDLSQALEIEPDFPGALDCRARARTSIGDHHGAAEDRLADLWADPWGDEDGMGVSPYRWSNCAESLILAGRKPEGRALLEVYFAKYSQGVTKYDWHETAPMRLLARLLTESGEFESACHFATLARQSPHHCPADLVACGEAFEASGRLREALNVCREALQENEHFESALELQNRLCEKA